MMAASTEAICLEGVRHGFALGPDDVVPALDLPRLVVGRGDTLAIRGPNGSGKTTLLNVIAGLLRPREGIVTVAGTDLGSLSGAERDRFRGHHIGFLFQALNLLDPLTALENVMAPAIFSRKRPRRDSLERSASLLEQFGLGSRMRHRPSQLSMGQQQRVAAARALVNDPDIVLCDEPTASLDEAGAKQLLEDLDRACADRGVTLVIASHDPAVLGAYPVFDLAPPAPGGP